MRGQRIEINYSSCEVADVESRAQLRLGNCNNPPVRTLLKVSDKPPEWRHAVNYAIDCLSVNDRACTPDDASFPWQISRIRNAAPDLADSKERPASAPSVFSLPLQLRDTRREEGSVPMFAASQTPTAQEAVLAQIAAQIERQRPNFVSIVATDVMDSLFLVKLLRANNPDQRLLLVDPDLLYLRAQEMISATGVMAATTLPNSTHLLISGIRQFNFDSEYQASVFQAAREAMQSLRLKADGTKSPTANTVAGPTSKRLDLGWSGAAIPPCDIVAPLTLNPLCAPPSPPLWLVALGKDGYWPIAQLRVPPPSGDPSMAPQKNAPGGKTRCG